VFTWFLGFPGPYGYPFHGRSLSFG
jgi:hypothetical protein